MPSHIPKMIVRGVLSYQCSLENPLIDSTIGTSSSDLGKTRAAVDEDSLRMVTKCMIHYIGRSTTSLPAGQGLSMLEDSNTYVLTTSNEVNIWTE